MNQNDNKNNLKLFFYKLAGITLAIIIIINVIKDIMLNFNCLLKTSKFL